jgi:hypothetical protein
MQISYMWQYVWSTMLCFDFHKYDLYIHIFQTQNWQTSNAVVWLKASSSQTVLFSSLLTFLCFKFRVCIWSSYFHPDGVKNFLFSRSSRPALRSTQPPLQWVPGALSPGVKRPGREVDHSPPTSAEVKKMWIYTSAPPYAFMAWCFNLLSTGTTLPLPYFHHYIKLSLVGKSSANTAPQSSYQTQSLQFHKFLCVLLTSFQTGRGDPPGFL